MSVDATQVMPRPDWSDPGIHLLDDIWLVTIFAILLATALPWLLGVFDVNFMAAALGLLALGAIHFAFVTLGRSGAPESARLSGLRGGTRTGEHRMLLTTLHIIGVCIVGFIWMNAGGLQNPAFLVAFALPVVGAIFLSRWQPYVMALIAIVLAGVVALAQVPELRWYAPELGTIGAWLASAMRAGAGAPFSGFHAPSSYYLVMLQVFAILIMATAVASEYLGTIFERLRTNLDAMRGEVDSSEAFWSSLIEDLPVPAFLIEPETLRILGSSALAGELCSTPPAENRSILDTVRFSFPDMIQELIVAGGTAPLSMVHVRDRLLATEVRVQHTARQGRRLALLTIADKTEDFTLRAALDAVGQAVLVIDGDGRIVELNKPSLASFAGLTKGADASTLLSLAGMPKRWWEPGLGGRRKMHVDIAPHVYQVTTVATPLPGEDIEMYIVTFLPVARAAIGDQPAVTATVRTPDAALAARSSTQRTSHR